MIELLFAAGLSAMQPIPVMAEEHVWRTHGGGGCPKARYAATIAGTQQTFELAHCGDWTLTVVSDAETAARAGLATGDIVFTGALNDEIGGPEGTLTLPGRCSRIDAETQPRLSRPWPSLDLGKTVTIDLPGEPCDAGSNAPSIYGSTLVFTRLPEAPLDPQAIPTPREGCSDWRIVSDGNPGFEPRIVRVCLDGSTLSGTADGRQVLEGVVWSLDGSIEAAYTPPAPDGCPARAYRVTGTALPTPTFELEGYAPIFGEACALEGYNDVRLHFEPAGT